MSRLSWDLRTYEAGIDEVVLYGTDRLGTAWSGVTGIKEVFDEKVDPIFLDGVKVFDRPGFSGFKAVLSAFTYPDEFLEYEGIEEIRAGVAVDSQPTDNFHLSYKTRIANDTDGMKHGYKIHILYNLTAKIIARSNTTITTSTKPLEFQWDLSAVPDLASHFRPTAHVIIDSRYLRADLLHNIETVIYGSDGRQAYLPKLDDALSMVQYWDPKVIQANPDGGLSRLVPGIGDLTETAVSGVYVALPTTQLRATKPDGFYILEPREDSLTIVDVGNGIWQAIDNGKHLTLLEATVFRLSAETLVMLDADTYMVSSTNHQP
jgi:hypothetical protein